MGGVQAAAEVDAALCWHRGKGMRTTEVRPAHGHIVTLPFKMSLLVAGTLIVFGLVVGTFGIDYFSDVLRQEAICHGKAVASTLASSLSEIIATQQDAAVSATIRSAKKIAGFAYVEVVNTDGTLIAHTYEGHPPRWDGRVRQEAMQIQDTMVAGQAVIDIPAEVITGAVIHVGLDRSAIEAKVSKARLVVIGLTLNLLSNACKFTERGTVWLQADRETVDGRDWITFRIRDTGIEMTPEQTEKPFPEVRWHRAGPGDYPTLLPHARRKRYR